MERAVLGWAAAGGIAYALLPWYAIEDGTFGFGWLSGYPTDGGVAPALAQVLRHGRLALLPVAVFLLAPLAVRGVRSAGVRAALLLTVGAGGTAWIAVQGFAVGGQPGIGLGGLVVFAALLMLFCVGLAATGAFNGDRFISGGIGAIVALVVVFVFFPVSRVLVGAVEDSSGAFAPTEFWTKLSTREVWGLDCLGSSAGCGVAWNTLILGVLVGASTTALGLAFALIVTRTGFRAKKALRLLTVLPIITPPFVIGLAVILLFGRAGAITTFMEWAFGVVPSRWIYGLPGVWLAQVLAFTPIAFLVLIGVVEGISPSMEEAAQTLRADRWRTFTTVSLPLMRPGLATAAGLCDGVAVGRLHCGHLRDDPVRRVRGDLGTGSSLLAPPLRGRLRRPRHRIRPALERGGLELLLDDPRDRDHLGAADRGSRAPHRLPARPPALSRQRGLRVRYYA